MKIHVRMSKKLESTVRSDLARSHPFAAERVGFLFAKSVRIAEDEFLILVARYVSVPDDEYVSDKWVGAKIGSAAILRAMQEAMDTTAGAFHIHTHDFSSVPEFSGTDRRSAALLIPSFQTVVPDSAHGAFLFGSTGCIANVWLPGRSKPSRATRISIVGHPLGIYDGGKYEQ